MRGLDGEQFRSVFGGRKQVQTIRGEEGKNAERIIEGGNGGVIITECKQCRYKINGRVAKLAIVACEEVNIEVDATVVTGLVELTKCKGVVVRIKGESVHTWQVDKSSDSTIEMEHDGGKLFTAGSSQIRVKVAGIPEYLIEGKDPDESQQYVTNVERGQLVTQKVLREGAGYPTTQEELNRQEEKDKRDEEKLVQYLRGIV